MHVLDPAQFEFGNLFLLSVSLHLVARYFPTDGVTHCVCMDLDFSLFDFNLFSGGSSLSLFVNLLMVQAPTLFEVILLTSIKHSYFIILHKMTCILPPST